jgi:hypothetical protein
MLFGNKKRFAVEIELNEGYKGEWLLGHFCFWIDGNMVGHYEYDEFLTDVLADSYYTAKDSGGRFCPSLFALPSEKIFNLIVSSIYGESKEILQYVPPDFMYAKFNIPVIRQWWICLIEGENQAKLLYVNSEAYSRCESEVREILLLPGEFEKVFMSAYSYLNSLVDKHSTADT